MALIKASFVVFASAAPVPTDLIVFQFNSETLTRRFSPQAAAAGSATTEKGGGGAGHAPGPPSETYTLTIELDASDQLEDDNPVTGAVGIHPAIAQLELLMYPPSSQVLLNRTLAAFGTSMVTPAETPLVLFVWGPTRVLPVTVTSLNVTEQMFDASLNPIQARVEIGLTVMTDGELARRGEPFTTLATVMHVAKEGLARMGTASSLASLAPHLPF